MPIPGKLKGKEYEILKRKQSGISEYKLAIEYGVYPNAIRQAVKRALSARESVVVGK